MTRASKNSSLHPRRNDPAIYQFVDAKSEGDLVYLGGGGVGRGVGVGVGVGRGVGAGSAGGLIRDRLIHSVSNVKPA